MVVTLRAEGLTFGYLDNDPILVEWNEDFRAGECVALTGPSGRGKSTLLYILGLMLKPSRGSVFINDADVYTLSDAERARIRAHDFGFVFQDAALDTSRSVLDNVTESALYRGEDRKSSEGSAMMLLEKLGVNLRAHHKPGQISGGQAQRISLARALLNNPSILLADEPTGNLDAESAEVVIRAMEEQAGQGSTVIVATHDHRLVERFPRTIRL